MNWIYGGIEILSHNDLHSDCTDFVYEISYTDGTKYIGKKTVRSIRRLKPTKKQLDTRKNYSRKELVNLPFIKYIGSSKDAYGKKLLKKEILYMCSNKRTSSYIEAKLLFCRCAIESDEYINKNISGRYFDNCLDGLILDYNDSNK